MTVYQQVFELLSSLDRDELRAVAREAHRRAEGQAPPMDLDHRTAAEISEQSSWHGVPRPDLAADLPFALDGEGRLREVHGQPTITIADHNRPDGRWCRWSSCRTIEPHGWCPDRCQEARPEATAEPAS